VWQSIFVSSFIHLTDSVILVTVIIVCVNVCVNPVTITEIIYRDETNLWSNTVVNANSVVSKHNCMIRSINRTSQCTVQNVISIIVSGYVNTVVIVKK